MNTLRTRRLKPGVHILAVALTLSLASACASAKTEEAATPTDSSKPSATETVLAVDFSPAEEQKLLEPYANWAEGAGPEWDALLAKAKKEGSVSIASTPNPAVRKLLAEQFEADTGIKVQYLPNAVPAEITGRLRTEAAAGKISLDVFLSGYPGVVDELPAGLLRPLAPELILPSVTKADGWDGGAQLWQDNDKKYLLRLLNYVTGYPTVNTDVVDPTTIKVFDDLLDPSLSGKIAQFDPRRPGPGSPAAVYIAVDKGRAFAEEFYTKQKPQFTTDQRQLADWVAKGTYPVGLGVDVQQSQALRSQGLPMLPVFPSDFPGLLTSGYGILRLFDKSPHPAAGTVLANWLASPRGAQVLQLSFDQPSTRADVEVTKNIPEEIIAKEGTTYVDQNTEDYVKASLVPGTKTLNEVIGQ
ncbi:MAG: hypothetical protein QOE19_2379 [Actinomycetota bacterium]|jgi:ABC-type Fe3+ transport system substrate-binding protein|nr:hypothetical protein [Actinomycetota bacterium]MDQ1666787.1 hypothetical protein [Actinomycetota bacterium]MDQ1669381.1 hypothetical protein [Actinomycetota bacterium]